MDIFSLGQVVVGALQVVTLIVQVWFATTQFSARNKQDSTYQCDSLYFQMTKLMIEHENLSDFYTGTVDGWESMTFSQRKMYLLAELNYFHFAFVHREFLQGRVSKEYWQLYERWMNMLLKTNKTFCQVREANSALFESVDEKLSKPQS